MADDANIQRDVGTFRAGLMAGIWKPEMSEQLLQDTSDPEGLQAGFAAALADPMLAIAMQSMLARSRSGMAFRSTISVPGDAAGRRSDKAAGGSRLGGKFDPHLHPHGTHGMFATTNGGKRPKVGKEGAGPAKAVAAARTKKSTTAPTRSKAGAAVKPKTAAHVKFDDSKHKSTIAEHKKIEAFHRTESLKIVAKQREIREQAKALPKSDKKGRADLKAQHQALGKQRDVHKAAATEARTSRVAESKAMQDARKQHVVAQATGKVAPAKAKADPSPENVKAARGAISDAKVKTASDASKSDPAHERKPEPAKAPIEPSRKTGEAATREHLDKSNASALAAAESHKKAMDSAADTDFDTARKHMADVNRHRDEQAAHAEAAQKSAQEHGDAALTARAEAETSAHRKIADTASHEVDRDVKEAEYGQRLSHSRREAPESGALTAGEFRTMSDVYAAKITSEQRVALQNYSDHADHILNPMLRASKGSPDGSTLMYGGDHAPAQVHAQRAEKAIAHQEGRYAGMSSQEAKPVTGALATRTVSHEMHDLDSAIAAHQMERDTKVYRVMRDDGKLTGGLQVGSGWSDHAYTSTTADKNVLSQFYSGPKGERVDMHITLKAGSSGAPLSSVSSFKGEREILLPRGAGFRVTKVVPAVGHPDGRDYTPKQIHLEST